jgi:hypothetical protein
MEYYEIYVPEKRFNKFWVIKESFGDNAVFIGNGYTSFFWAMIKLCVQKR